MRNVLVITDTRAEYGILKNTLKKIEASDKLNLQLVVTGAHLQERYGYTVSEIEDDGFEITEKIFLINVKDDKTRVSMEMGDLMIKLTQVFNRLSPDIVVLFGDRYEMLASACVAVGMHIPIAHISGGEITQGAMDEQIRHAITKMAHIHFPGATPYAKNIEKMGEEVWRIYDVGDPGIENINEIKLVTKDKLESDLNITIGEDTLLVTYHPVTLERRELESQIDNLIHVLSAHNGTKIITYPNSDDGSELIINKLKKYAENNDDVCLVQSLGIVRYLSVMKYCGAIVGNSSSAIVEAPHLKVPAVNVGNRQKGRLMAESIVCCDNSIEGIQNAIKKALSKEFREFILTTKSLYGEGNTSSEIVSVLETIELDEMLMKKKLEWR